MTFTRKTGRARPVENEATVDVEVTQPKRNLKKTVAVADLPSSSQRAGKKRIHEGSAGSPLKRKKPDVQPPPKPAVPKARTKVLAPRRAKKEMTDSVEAIVDEGVVVEKERSSEGPWLIKRYFKVDVISNVQWAYMKPDDISAAFAGISEFQIRRLGLRGVITVSMSLRMPRSISGPIIHFVKSALHPVIPEDDSDGEDDKSMGPHPKLLDLVAYQFKCVRDKMCQVKKHLEQPNNSRLRETFVDQVLTHLLIHLDIYKPSPEEDLNDDTQVILHEDVGSSKRRGAAKPCSRPVGLSGPTQGSSAVRSASRAERPSARPHGPALGQQGREGSSGYVQGR
ncbi:hypothetical protein R1sor_011327 [Riccia sorocarpa]|uniref:Uncharacterized protein n=1 Tax=Riccia sorocarpa TaxID=122646 RepID=A0ABD3I1R6_9MARC